MTETLTDSPNAAESVINATPSSEVASQSKISEVCGSDSAPPTIRRPVPGGLSATWERIEPRLIGIVRRTVKDGRWPLTLHGPAGSGKSCLLGLLGASWPRDGVRWFAVRELIGLIQQARRDGEVMLPGAERSVTEGHIWRTRIDGPTLLLLDDLGTRQPTDSQYDIILQVLDRRRRKPMAVSSNLSPEDLGDLYDDRVVSRLSEGTAIEMNLPDQRLATGKRYRITTEGMR